MNSAVRVMAALLVLLTSAVASGRAQEQQLADVLKAYEAEGYVFVYSNHLVRNASMITLDPDETLTIPRLQTALARIGLGLEASEANDGSVTWYVIPQRTAEQTGALQGRITDAHSGLPLAGVRVEIAGQVVFTDATGHFLVPADSGPPLQVSRPGYRALEVSVDERLDELLEITLEADRRLEEVVVVSSRYALERGDEGSRHTLTAHDLNTIPEFGDDVLRAANHLPGTASIGLSARPYIRGGLQDETLILFNNVELLEPFHLKDFQSVFSGFNPSLVKSVDVYTGGFPARYGDRMSGVMDIKPADDISGFGADVMLSFLTASAALVGTSQNGRGAWALSARRGNLDLVLDVMDPTAGTPNYADYFGSFSYEIGPATEIETGFIYYNDDIELKDLDDGDGELARSVYKNGYGWVQLHHRFSERMDSTTVLSYGNIKNERNGFINDEDLEEGSSSLEDRRHFELWHLGHSQYLSLSETLTLEFGGHLNHQQGSYDTHAVLERGELASLIGLPISEERIVNTRPSGTSGGLYGSARYFPAEWLSLEAGLRWDYRDYAGDYEQHLSPRLSMLFSVAESTELRLSAGRFYQTEQIHELQAADGVDEFQQAQYADHYIAGIQHELGETGLSLRVEGFYKQFRKPKRRFENLFNSLQLMPELASDRIEVAPTRARARGVELSLAFQPRPELNAWFAYTHAYADDELNGTWVQRGWDQRHSISTGIVWEPGDWSLSAAVLWHSGWQTTLLPESIDDGELPTLERNADRLPDYFTLDFKISRTWRWENQSLNVFLELTNALNRDNVGAIEYDVLEDAGGGFVLPREPVTLLPRIPSLGVRWRFN